ncbi:MAG TPA: hypothetical protein VGR07_04690 [Thermoanaerobaculia bacterium]|jgi:hypothetical protein|nr:hypothetical protein [Thermoanaerobaculia bacterium]
MEQAAGHLSPAAQRFLTYITSTPERTRRLDHLAAGEFFAPLQSWPTFVGGEKLAEVRRATVALTQLVKSVPERIFGNDPRRIAAFYGFPTEAPIAIILAPPDGLDSVLVRNDYIDTPDGFKCLEVNAGQIGGWQLRYFEQRVRTHPVIARFLEEAGIAPYYRDPLAELLKFIIDHNLGKPAAASGVLNIAITMSDLTLAEGEGARLTRTYRDLLQAGGTGLTGEVVLCSCTDLARRQDQIWHRDRLPIHALVIMSEEAPPQTVFRTFKAGRLSLYNGPVNGLLNDKRTLALLSERASSSLFTTEERDLLERTLPWTRTVGPSEATYRGETRPLPDLLLAHREDFVLKPARGNKGEGVTFGRSTPPGSWERVVAEAVVRGGWLAQARVDSRPYVYQHGEQGYGEHDVVWGTFCFGESYGGGFLRMVPRGMGDHPINAALGASEGVLFEV